MHLSNVDLISILGLCLTVVALLLATAQSWQAHGQAVLLARQNKALEFVTASVSTRYIGPFPEWIPEVTELVKGANRELLILAANPVLGYFGRPDMSLELLHAIESKARSSVVIKLICQDERSRAERLRRQFPSSAQEWTEWLPKNQTKVEEFLRYRHPEINTSELDYEKFIDLHAQTQREIIRESYKLHGVDVSEVDLIMAMQVWIADRQRAVFSFEAVGTKTYGLSTSDPSFVEALYLTVGNVYGSRLTE